MAESCAESKKKKVVTPWGMMTAGEDDIVSSFLGLKNESAYLVCVSSSDCPRKVETVLPENAKRLMMGCTLGRGMDELGLVTEGNCPDQTHGRTST